MTRRAWIIAALAALTAFVLWWTADLHAFFDSQVYSGAVRYWFRDDGMVYDWLRPGMSAEVEILVESLQDAVYVPLQAVTYLDDRQVVYVADGGEPVAREVEVGSFSEQFIEIVAGVQAGEQVLLLAPPGASL